MTENTVIFVLFHFSPVISFQYSSDKNVPLLLRNVVQILVRINKKHANLILTTLQVIINKKEILITQTMKKLFPQAEYLPKTLSFSYAPRYCVTERISQIPSVPSKSLAKLPSTKEGQRSFGSQAHSYSTCLLAPDCFIGQQHDNSRRLRRHEGHSFAEIQREKRIILDESA